MKTKLRDLDIDITEDEFGNVIMVNPELNMGIKFLKINEEKLEEFLNCNDNDLDTIRNEKKFVELEKLIKSFYNE